ncbi:MAG: ArnT family glycosyltransferase [Rhodoferax sp.]
MNHRPPLSSPGLDTATMAWLALLAFTVGVYAFGLGGQYIPSIGDELVYSHIARLTAASRHWLPLVSELDQMRNTKPPLLFWQAMLAGDWGRDWSMQALRAPSLLYTLLTAGAVLWSVRLITGNLRTALAAACVYLAFFCTFRFGRPYLTSAPETFWLNLPMFWLLWQRLRAAPVTQAGGPGWLAHAGFGLALGLGLAYKSFALIAPAAAALWCAELLSGPALKWRSVIECTLKVCLSATLALGIFALWFALDPDPGAVWREFVVGENAGKLSNDQGYWQLALFGGGVSIWAQLLAYVQNAGLLAFVVLGLIGLGLKNALVAKSSAKEMPVHLVLLLCWLAVWLIVFTLPSQRSARYVIPAMPALAMLIALCWQRIGRIWFALSLLLCGIFIAALGRVAWAAHEIGIGSGIELAATLSVVAAGLLLVLGGMLRPAWTRGCTIAASIAVYASFGLSIAPLDGAPGRYPDQVAAQLHHASIAVPNGFNGQFERFQFLLPGNRFIPYDSEERAASRGKAAGSELGHLLASHDAVIWLQSEPSELTPPCAPDCKLLGWRWEVKGRHQRGEIHWGNLWYPQLWLFRREWLVTNGLPSSGVELR